MLELLRLLQGVGNMSECFKCGSGNETLISDKLVPELHCFSCYNKEIDSLNTSSGNDGGKDGKE